MWVITKDHVESGRRVGVGRVGPYAGHDDCTSIDQLTAKIKSGFQFRMYDDDGILYYEGYSLCDSDFGPLDDFGTPNAGATEIRYRNRKSGMYTRL